MSLFIVNDETCIRCGICLEVCPAQIIEMKNPNAVPTLRDSAEKACINCGHCVAICPQGALTHQCMTPDQCAPLRKDWMVGPEQAEHFLRTRRSIRCYQERPIDRQLLLRLVEIASHAPTGHNSQTVNWHIVYKSEEVHKLAGLVVDWMRNTLQETPAVGKAMNLDRVVSAWEQGIDRVCRSAPHLIVAHAPSKDRFAQNSCPIALSYLELAAPSFGLGTCWGGYFTAAAKSWPPLQEALNLPEGHLTFGVLLVGVPKYGYQRLPIRKEPRITWS